MNVHPLFVHFPIAFLSLYSILEILSFGWVGRLRNLTGLKAFLLVVGTIAAFVTLQTGELAEKVFGGEASRPLIEMHSTFATAVTYLYLLIAVCYLVRVTNEAGKTMPVWAVTPWKWLTGLQGFILNFYVGKLLALIAFLMMVIVGALGASLVYGPDIDPAVNFIYHLFFAAA
jgi:uncharacterized membrane protein